MLCQKTHGIQKLDWLLLLTLLLLQLLIVQKENRKVQHSHSPHLSLNSLYANISQSDKKFCLRLAVTNLY